MYGYRAALRLIGERFFGSEYFELERKLPYQGISNPLSYLTPTFFPQSDQEKLDIFQELRVKRMLLLEQLQKVSEQYLKNLALFLFPNRDLFFLHTACDLAELSSLCLKRDREKNRLQVEIDFLVSKGLVSRMHFAS